MPQAFLKKASHCGRLFCFTIWLTSFSGFVSAETNCPPSHIDTIATVSYVYDGDTVRLRSGDKVRFIGINTPEMARKQRPAEPLAKEARQALITLLKQHQYQVHLRYGQQQRDRYGRLLAHAYTPDNKSISDYLLNKGLANLVAITPNVKGLSCYAKAEKLARQNTKGLWKLSNIINSSVLSPQTRGFKIIRGKVVRIGESKRNLWLNLEGGLALRIPKKDLHWFTKHDPRNFNGKMILARGWIYERKGEQRIRVQHPLSLELLNE